MQMSFARCYWIGCLLLATSAVARGEGDAQPVSAASQSDQLVLGDWYTVDARRGPVSEQFTGRLVKANDQWLVLHKKAFERKTSTLSSLPGVGRFFVGSKTQGYNEYTWIVRDAAMVFDRKPNKTATPAVNIDEDFPRQERDCQLIVAAAGKVDWRAAEIVDMRDENLVLANEKIPLGSVLAIRVGRLIPEKTAAESAK